MLYSRRSSQSYSEVIVDSSTATGLYKKELSFIRQAIEVSSNSKDENSKIGAVIVDKNGRVASVGYNGAVAGIPDSSIPYTRTTRPLSLNAMYVSTFGDKYKDAECFSDLLLPNSLDSFYRFEENKYPFMIHAEQNAIIHCSDLDRLVGGTIYITSSPCPVCTNLIAQKKISKIVVLAGEVASLPPELLMRSLYIMSLVNIELVVYTEN